MSLLCLRVVDGDGTDGQSSGGENGKIYVKGMNMVRQISRRFGRTTEARTRSAADHSITATISVVPDPLGAQASLKRWHQEGVRACIGTCQGGYLGKVVNVFLLWSHHRNKR